jgi:hypothetical protein
MWGQRFLWAWMAVILICGAASFHTQAPLATLHCPPDERQANTQSHQEGCASFDVLFARSMADLQAGIGDFIHQNRDDIIAVSTLVVAIFTGTLWWVTWGMVRIAKDQQIDTKLALEVAKQSADAATKSANAVLGVELPRFTVSRIYLNKIEEDIRVAIQDGFPIFYFVNEGRTSAEVIAESVDWEVCEILPAEPMYGRASMARLGTIIQPGEEYITKRRHGVALALSEVDAVVTNKSRLWVYGRIVYRDFIGNIKHKRFCCRLIVLSHTGGFYQQGPPQYNSTI